MRTWSILTAILVGLASGCTPMTITETDSASAVVSSTTSTTVPAAPGTTSVATTSTTTTTTSATTTVVAPPVLEVTYPVDGAVVTSPVYRFRGRTTPGCTVDVGGKYFADVDGDGNWELDLMLRPGANATTFTATDASGLTTTAQIRLTYLERPPLTLRHDGFGPFDFGTPAADVVEHMTEVWGSPDIDATSHRTETDAPRGGVCAGGFGCWEYVRLVTWQDERMLLAFSDLWCRPGEDWPCAEVPMTFVSYDTGNPALETPEGVGVGSTVADLEAAYGTALATGVSDDEGPVFFVRLDEHDTPYGGSGYWGTLSADPAEAASRVASLAAGSPSSFSVSRGW